MRCASNAGNRATRRWRRRCASPFICARSRERGSDMRTLFLTVLLVLLAGCATALDPTLQEARDHVAGGRSEQALILLERASRENPERLDFRAEYVRVRDLVAAQWLAQAETLRSSGQPEAAASLYRRVQKYDADSVRARVGLQQLEADARARCRRRTSARGGRATRRPPAGRWRAASRPAPAIARPPGRARARTPRGSRAVPDSRGSSARAGSAP